MQRDDSFIPQMGNYRNLISFRKAQVIYDITYYFAHKFLKVGDRTIDQMVQAARSGKQNIVEGSAASTTSRETEIKLLNVAKASMHELLTDYEDYLRVRALRRWEKGEPKFEQTRRYCILHNDSVDFTSKLEERSDETIANIAIILIYQTDYLLFRQIETLKKQFLEKGGIREQMADARRKYRSQGNKEL